MRYHANENQAQTLRICNSLQASLSPPETEFLLRNLLPGPPAKAFASLMRTVWSHMLPYILQPDPYTSTPGLPLSLSAPPTL